MLRVINGILVAALLCVAFWLYQLEYQARVAENEIRGVRRQMQAEFEAIRLLRAEWAYLSRPQRIEDLARKHLTLAPLKAEQIIGAGDLVKVIPEYDRFRKPEDGDPIADLLQGLE